MMVHLMNEVIQIPESGIFSLVVPEILGNGTRNPRSTEWDSESRIRNLESTGVEPRI